MKHKLQLDNDTSRLAATYFAIIMALTICFSAVFYEFSAGRLHIQVLPQSLHGNRRTYTIPAGTLPGIGHFHAADMADLNSQLQGRLTALRTDILRSLIVLNSAVAIVGSGLSYYLARRTLKPIKDALAAQSRFASDASHELRTPLAVLQTQNEAALRKRASLPEVRALASSNLEEIIRLHQLSDKLLQLARDEAMSVQPVGVEEIATVAVNNVFAAAQDKHIRIQNNWTHTSVMADHQALEQVLIILLDNAIKYSSKDTTVWLELAKKDGHAYLQVSDEGTGIAKQHLPYIFDRFYRVDHSRSKATVAGHGLGLAIAAQLMKQQKGEIAATSALGKGTTFTLKLPLAPRP